MASERTSRNGPMCWRYLPRSKRNSTPHILVNNAGMFFPAKFEELTKSSGTQFSTQTSVAVSISQTAAPMLRRSGQGRIVNSRRSRLLAWPATRTTCVSKAGVITADAVAWRAPSAGNT